MRDVLTTSARRCAMATAVCAIVAGAAAAQSTVAVRMKKSVFETTENLTTVRTIDYGPFVWLEMTEEEFARLETMGLDYQVRKEHDILHIQDFVIDPQDPPPGPVTSHFFLMKLVAPNRDAWVHELEMFEVELLQYYDPFAYLVRMPVDSVEPLHDLDFVRWVVPYLPEYKIPENLRERAGRIDNVTVTLYDSARRDLVRSAIESQGGILVDQEAGRASDPFTTLTFSLPSSALDAVARIEDVVWANYRMPVDPVEDEMSCQIVAGNGVNPGYQAFLSSFGLSGNGVTIALIDSGYDTGVDATAHPDVSGRLIPLGNPIDTDGHGTHVGGIMASNGSLGTTDSSGFLAGLGMAPQVSMVARYNTGNDSDRTMDAVTNGAVASNNSYSLHDPGLGYEDRDRTYDILVRDADQTTGAVAEELIIVFSAGNCGVANPPTCPVAGLTKEAKNVISVANSLNDRDGTGTPNVGNDIDMLRASSSRGPAGDGRVYPHLTAPGTNIVSTHSSQITSMDPSCDTIATGANAPGTDPTYSMCSGTSMSAPHVTGAVALITEWWRTMSGGADPSPALAKALLVNTAVDMDVPDIPNGNEGWGRISMDGIFDPAVFADYFDQEVVFADTGDTWTATFYPAMPGEPTRFTLTWTDAPGPGGGGNPMALVNDLDLTVVQSGTTFRGNNFSGGFSLSGGSSDGIDNLENVYIEFPGGPLEVTVLAAAINGDGVPYSGDGTDQDFALVCSNCIVCPPILTTPSSFLVFSGDTCVGDTSYATLTICNTGCDDLLIDSISSSDAQFVVQEPFPGFPLLIEPAFCFPFQVAFTPTAMGARQSTLTIESNDPVRPSVMVTATGIGGEPDIVTVIADGGMFGNVCRNDFRDLELTIANSGPCPLEVSNITSNNPLFQVPGVVTFPIVVGAEDSIGVPVRFAPGNTPNRAEAATITVHSDDPDQSMAAVAVSGDVPRGEIVIVGSTDFGSVCPEDTEERTISVCNVGLCNLNVVSASVDNPDFTIVSNRFPAPISHDFCLDLIVRFTPTSLGQKNCTLTIVSDDQDEGVLEIPLTGFTPAPSIDVPPDLGFAPTVIQSDGPCFSAEPFPISNTGECNLIITNIAITPGASIAQGPSSSQGNAPTPLSSTTAIGVSEEFTLAGLPSFPIILEPGHIVGSGDLRIEFRPEALSRARTATISVTYVTDPFLMTEATVTRMLCGEGVHTGARVLVTHQHTPFDEVKRIKLRRINANSNGTQVDTIDNVMNVPVVAVNPPAPCEPFQYHREYGTVSNPIQLLPGSYLLDVDVRIDNHMQSLTVGFDVSTCDFNPSIVVNFQ